jgi:clan AA aspartic protease (TIGR02281 family)
MVKGNSVLVPVKLVHGGEEADIQLLLDTGATRTMISTDIAERLSIKLGKERKTQVQIVGGAVIDAHVVRVNSLTVGPHAKRNWDIVVVPHKGPVVEYDGLLGMDVLRDLKYRVDFKKKIIVWN